MPSRGSNDAAGLDLYSNDELSVSPGQRVAVRTGLAVEIPQGYYGRIAPRSGLALKNGIDVLAGVIDADYRGEVKCLLINLGESDFEIRVGDRIAQLLVERIAILIPEWDDLTETHRSQGGFGSTG